MKTKLFSMFAVVAMLLTTSCSNDETNELISGEPVTTSFKVQLPNSIGTRPNKGAKKAFADGMTATVLKYMVFDENNNLVIPAAEKAINRSTDVQLTLITGKKYKIVFWAANAEAPYTIDETGKVTVNYEGMKTNDESLDAFCRCYEYTAGAEVENPVKLYRPFAQLNVGTKDMDKAVKAGFKKADAKTKVQVSGIANTLNLLTGEVDGEVDVTCDLNAIPTGETFPKEGYEYLSMDYLLVGKETKSVVDVKWTVTDGTFNSERTFTNVPLQGNYRTNIFGNLLTSPTDFNVEIDPAFNEPDYDVPVPATEVKDQNQLSEAVKENGAVVKLAPNTTYKLPATVGDNIHIFGNEGAKFEVPAAVAWPGKTATFHNVKLVYEQKNYVGIQHAKTIKYENCEIAGQMFSYAENSEFVGCVFTQNEVNYNIWTYGSKNIKFTNCTFNCKGKAALLYSESATLAQTATFDNCKFNASAPATDKAAIEIDSSLGTNYDVYIKNCVATGFDLGSVSGNSLWNQKKGHLTNLWVDGVQNLTRE